MNEPWTRLLRAWPVIVLVALALVFSLMLLFSRKAPIITSLDPSMAVPGQQVVVSGDYFGRTAREGSLSLAGEIPPPSLIQSWTDQKIVFIVPEDATSGLVTVSNSQGTSTAVLFTNTQTIPTVLQAPGTPIQPLIWAVVPAQALPGQPVTVTGRNFGGGDEAVAVRIATPHGPVWEVGPGDSLSWSDRSVTFRWPPGANPGTAVTLVTPRGESPPFSAGGAGPTEYEAPNSMTVEIRAQLTLPASTSASLWGPFPQRMSGTAWTMISADPTPNPRPGSPTFFWAAGSGATRQAAYRLKLTTWARRWDGTPRPAPPAPVPAGSPLPSQLWKPAAAALKLLTAKWGLEITDTWVRLQRLQTGLAAAFVGAVAAEEKPELTRAPAELLARGPLTSFEISTLGAALATQAGLTVRLVSGLWQRGDGTPLSRTWTEVWFGGAGWVPWDIIDGSPGILDNRHFAFDAGSWVATRRAARSVTFGPPPPGTLRNASGEAAGSSVEPVVQWQINRVEK